MPNLTAVRLNPCERCEKRGSQDTLCSRLLCFDWQKLNKSSNRWLQGCFSLTQRAVLVQTAQRDLPFTCVNHLYPVWYWTPSHMIYSKFHINAKRKSMLQVFAALNHFLVQAQNSIIVGKTHQMIRANSHFIPGGSFSTDHHLNDLYSSFWDTQSSFPSNLASVLPATGVLLRASFTNLESAFAGLTTPQTQHPHLFRHCGGCGGGCGGGWGFLQGRTAVLKLETRKEHKRNVGVVFLSGRALGRWPKLRFGFPAGRCIT